MQRQGTGTVGLGQLIAEWGGLGGELIGVIQFLRVPNGLGGCGRSMERQLHAGEALPVLWLLGVQFRGQLCRAKGIGEQATCHQFTGQCVAAGCC